MVNLKNHKIVVALSGGIDSVVLLHYLKSFNIRAIHINHNLNSNSNNWANFCKNLCQELSVDLQVINIKIDTISNIEKKARDKRYKVLFDNLQEDEILTTAHHQDDQAETVLLQLFRGSGVLGLSAMKDVNNKHYRPFLDKTKCWINNYAIRNNLSWIEDDSNFDTSLRRNFLRLEVMPIISKKYKNINNILSRVAKHQQESFLLNNELAELDIVKYKLLTNNLLNGSKLMQLPQHRISNILRYHIYKLQWQMPSYKVLQQMLLLILHIKNDSKAMVCWGEYKLMHYKKLLYFLYNKQQLIDNNCPYYQQFKDVKGFTIGYRKYGQRIKFKHKKHSQTLKKIMQEFNIPPWERDKLRLYYINNELKAIEKIGIL